MNEFAVMCVNVRQNANAWDWQDANAFLGKFRNILWEFRNTVWGISKWFWEFRNVLGNSNAFWGILNCSWQIRNDGKMNFQSKLN